jgi:HEAT repeat protein/transcriptional regulator with XRE-family HTH domain
MADTPQQEALAELRERLKNALVAKRYPTQDALARRAGLGRTAVNQALSLTSSGIPSDTTVRKLAIALGLDVAPLLALRQSACGEPARHLHSDGKQPTPPHGYGLDQRSRKAVAAYARRLLALYDRVPLSDLARMAGTGLERRVRLSEVFVPPRLQADVPPPQISPSDFQEDTARVLTRLSGLASSSTNRDALETLLDPDNKCVVILGDPGSGKSTLVSYLGVRWARDQIADGPPATARHFVPLVISLQSYRPDHREPPRFDQYLMDRYDESGLGLPADVLSAVLTQGRAALIFDGLDEILDPAARIDTMQRILDCTSLWPETRIIVTSRLIGYQRAVLDQAGFSHYTIVDFDRAAINQYLRQWYASVGIEPDLASRRAQEFAAQPAVQDLARNPLLLTLLAAVGRDPSLPSDRVGLYQHAVSLLIDDFTETARNLPRAHPPAVADLLHALDVGDCTVICQRVARVMMQGTNGVTGNAINSDDLFQVVARQLHEELGASHALAEETAAVLVRQMSERSGILMAYGPNVYGFIHRTFLEYLAAVDICQRYRSREWTAEELLEDVIALRARDPAWHETLLLVISQLEEHDAAQAVDRLLMLGTSGELTPADSAVLALRALAGTSAMGALIGPSIAAVDAAIMLLTPQLRQRHEPVLTQALPTLASFSPQWPGRERFLRWYCLVGQFTQASDEPARAVCALQHSLEDLLKLAHRTYASAARIAILHHITSLTTGPAAARRLLLAALTAGQPSARIAAAHALADKMDQDDETPRLLTARAANDPDPSVRAAILTLLAGHWGRDGNTLTLLAHRATVDPDPCVRWTIVISLANTWRDNPEARTVTAALAGCDSDPTVRAISLQATMLMANGSTDTRNALLRFAARLPDAQIRCMALRNLARRAPQDENAFHTVKQAATDPHELVRCAAVETLAQHWAWREDTLPVVRQAAEDPDGPVRAVAIETLAQRWATHSDILAIVDQAARDNHPDARFAAFQAQAWLRGTDHTSWTSLTGAVAEDPDPTVRRRLMHLIALAEFDGFPAQTSLEERTRHEPDPAVRECAWELLASFHHAVVCRPTRN